MGEDLNSSETVRVRGISLSKSIVFGSHAQLLPQKRESDNHTHDWTVYVKPFFNEDMSSFVKKVQFKLHDTYNNPLRVCSKPPYEVKETGWGEFEIQIRIYFHDPAEKPVTIYHLLKLFHTNEAITSTAFIQGRQAVVSEFYDEIVFQDPTQTMHSLLKNARPSSTRASKHETNFDEKRAKTLTTIQTGRSRVQSEINEFKLKLQLAKETISRFKEEIAKVEKEKGQNLNSTIFE